MKDIKLFNMFDKDGNYIIQDQKYIKRLKVLNVVLKVADAFFFVAAAVSIGFILGMIVMAVAF